MNVRWTAYAGNGMDSMKQSSNKQYGIVKNIRLWISVLCAAIALFVCFSSRLKALIVFKHDHIRDLQYLSVGAPVRIRGVVTYSDPIQKRFWIQDETGAIAIDQDPRSLSIHTGQTVMIVGQKRRPYSILNGPSSIKLSISKLSVVSSRSSLPEPLLVSLKTLPRKDKTGVRIQLTGVIHTVALDSNGQTQLSLGDSGQEVLATISEADNEVSRWLNSRVRVVGINDALYDQHGTVQEMHIWIQSGNDVHLERPASKNAPLYSIRSLYLHYKDISAHNIRVRGTVVSRPEPNSFLVEDQWGAIYCRLDGNNNLPVGSHVEITGFPVLDHLRIDLLHSSVHQIPAIEADKQYASPPPLITIESVRSLEEKQADQALRVRITGVITYHDPEWKQLFLQDTTGGIFVKYPGSPRPLRQGQRITVVGLTNGGDFAPVIVAPKFLAIDKGILPRPVQLTNKEAISASVDSQLVIVEGVVHPIKNDQEPLHLTFELFSPVGQIHVEVSPEFIGKEKLKELVDATVRMQGVFSPLYNTRRQLVAYKLSISSIHNIEVLESPGLNPFQQPAVPISHLLGYSLHADYTHRIKLSGTVSMVGLGSFYLQDSSGGIKVQSEAQQLRVADQVEVVGYASTGSGYSPILTDAVVQVVGHNAALSAFPFTADSISDGQFDSQLVSVDGRLLSMVDSQNGKALLLQSGARTIRAHLGATDEPGALPSLQEGSILRVTGICTFDVKSSEFYLVPINELTNFDIIMRSPRDVEVLQAAPWWTAQHAVVVLSILFLVIVVTLAWISMLRRRVRGQIIALQKAKEKAAAIRELGSAMQEVTLQKDFSGRVAIRDDEEIALLGTEFNKMLAELQLREIAKQKAEEKLQYQALTDELTGLPNRRLLSDRLSQTLAIAKREHNIVALLYIDLDGFKLVNDSLGHLVGDLLLAQVSERLQARIRQSDTLARLGGDEFTVVLAKLACKEDAGRVGNSLLEVLSKSFFIENHEITISASIGISLFPENGADGIDLLQQADSAMYTAKRNGKNQMMYFTTELGSTVRERLSIENQLRGAISRNEIGVHYQPEFDIVSGRLIRFEALARWVHPTLGAIPPTKFIPIAEESGLIIPFGAYIMERACADAVTWQTTSAYPVQVAVNVSSLQFMRDTFVQEVSEILNRTGLKPDLLQIELTESVTLKGTERAAQIMQELRDLGVSIAIDDFGTGYSCFSYLPRLPFNALKIDRSFVKELEARAETKAMVQSLVALAHNLGMQVIVEGIETNEQLAMIKSFGGNEVQGYLLGRPTPDPTFHLNKMHEQTATEMHDKMTIELPAEKGSSLLRKN